jgi:hypothetical protein
MPPVTEQEKKDWARQDPGLKHINPGAMPNGRTDEQWAARRKGQRDSVLDGATMLDDPAPAPPTREQPRNEKGQFQPFEAAGSGNTGLSNGTSNPQLEPGDQTWDSFSGGPQTWDEAKGAWAEAGKQPYNGDSLLGGIAKLAGNLIASQIPVVGVANAVSGVLGGPTIGGALRSLVAPPNPNLPLAAPLPPQRPYDLTTPAPKTAARAAPAAAPAAVAAPAPRTAASAPQPTAAPASVPAASAPVIGGPTAIGALSPPAAVPTEEVPVTEEQRLNAPAAPVQAGFFANAFENFPAEQAAPVGPGYVNGVNQVGPVTDWAAPSAVEREAMFQQDMLAEQEDARQVANAIADQRSPAQAMEKGTWADQEGVQRSMAADLPADESPPEERSVQLSPAQEAQAEQAQAEQQAETISGQEWDDTLLGGDNLTTNGAVGVDWADVTQDIVDSSMAEAVGLAAQTGAISPEQAAAVQADVRNAPSMTMAQDFVGQGLGGVQDYKGMTDMPTVHMDRTSVDHAGRMTMAEIDNLANQYARDNNISVQEARAHLAPDTFDTYTNRAAAVIDNPAHGRQMGFDGVMGVMNADKQFSPVNGPKNTGNLLTDRQTGIGSWADLTEHYASQRSLGMPAQKPEVDHYLNQGISHPGWDKNMPTVEKIGYGDVQHTYLDSPRVNVPDYSLQLDYVSPQMDKGWANAQENRPDWADTGTAAYDLNSIGGHEWGFDNASRLSEDGVSSSLDGPRQSGDIANFGGHANDFGGNTNSTAGGWASDSTGQKASDSDWAGSGIQGGTNSDGAWDTSTTGWSGDGGWADSGTNDSGTNGGYDGGSYSGNNDGQNSPGDSARGGGSVGSNGGGGYDGRGSDNSPSEGARGGGSGNSNNERGYDGGSSGYADNGGYSGQDAPSRDW